MAIPDFNANGVLPPHVGNPAVPAELSPFPATTLELCEKYGFTPERRAILLGFLDLREALLQIGIQNGFQWIDGSFVEDVEHQRGRPPGDIDIVTFYFPPVTSPVPTQATLVAVLQNRTATKTKFRVDHLAVNLSWPARSLVDSSRYWCGLFSHQRGTEIWKGMVQVDLNTSSEDIAARRQLTTGASI